MVVSAGPEPRGRAVEAPAAQVSVVLVSWNAAAVIDACLASLLDVGAHEVIVVDNASSDDTVARVRARFPWVRLAPQARNLGFAAGVNVGVAMSSADSVLMLNCDTVVHPGAIDRLQRALAGSPDAGAVGGCLVSPDGFPQHGFHVRRFPTLATFAVDLWLIDKVWPGNPVTRRYRAEDQTRGATAPVEVDQPAAACLMVRRLVLEHVGGLDAGFRPAWFEDVDLCRRICQAGRKILFVPDARFTHEGGLAMRHLGPGLFARAWYRNMQRYVRKHHGVPALLACKAMIVSGMALRVPIALALLRPADARAYAHAGLEALTWWPHVEE